MKTPLISKECSIAYRDTGAFSSLILDYVEGDVDLSAFHQWPVNESGIRAAIQARHSFPTNRSLLVSVLSSQYGATAHPNQQANIQLLQKPNTFTVCTAHQPNLFTGHLYFIYKILHAIRLSADLNERFPDSHFVPVYYMGSEDADLEELGQIHLGGRDYQWQTRQTGAVGRMKVDTELLSMIRELYGQLIVEPYGEEWIGLLEQSYSIGLSIAEATAKLVNALFGRFGLLVLEPDNHLLKQSFSSVLLRELLEQFSASALQQTASRLGKKYHVQAAGRAINLFYLQDGIRERIEPVAGNEPCWMLMQTGKHWDRVRLLEELAAFPERFSPNVILRPLYQEWILPNVAFIGGGGELAYWLELKDVFMEAGIPLPVLVLRNSFLLAGTRHARQLKQLGLEWKHTFLPPHQMLDQWVKHQTPNSLTLQSEQDALLSLYEQIEKRASTVDSTLIKHVKALHQKASRHLTELEKKMLRAEKRKHEAEHLQINHLKNALFPGGNLQERVENIMHWYARHGSSILDDLLQHSGSLDQQFTVLVTK